MYVKNIAVSYKNLFNNLQIQVMQKFTECITYINWDICSS